ncbi:MAG: NUDIX domain-containing protein [bacterium]|nr:NUDIX domain-containing protein [bacterium]
MPVECCAGAVIFRREGKEGRVHYLLLRYPTQAKRRVGDEGKLRRRQTSSTDHEKEHWGFSKGHVEKGEGLEETARREIKEETGLRDIRFIKGFKESEKYFFTRDKKKIYKTVTFLLAETRAERVVISSEHLDFKWLPYKEALERLTFKNAKGMIERVDGILLKKYIA